MGQADPPKAMGQDLYALRREVHNDIPPAVKGVVLRGIVFWDSFVLSVRPRTKIIVGVKDHIGVVVLLSPAEERKDCPLLWERMKAGRGGGRGEGKRDKESKREPLNLLQELRFETIVLPWEKKGWGEIRKETIRRGEEERIRRESEEEKERGEKERGEKETSQPHSLE